MYATFSGASNHFYQAFQLICWIFKLVLLDGFNQDPVYGRGKLAEIQGLILGMLDTFTYEQVTLRPHVFIQGHVDYN